MCLIIHNPLAKDISFEIIDTALCTNPDGFGIFYHDTGEIKRTMDWNKPYDWIDSGRPYTCHFRYATSGPISKRNCHPFTIDDRYSLMMNGTIDRLKSTKSVDTRELCKILSGLSEDKILSILRTYACRFALLDKQDGRSIVVNQDLWTKHDGVLYSKANCLPDDKPKWTSKGYTSKKHEQQPFAYTDPWDSWNEDDISYYNLQIDKPDKDEQLDLHTVAVYGTLKSGHGNHSRFLTESYCLGDGRTCDDYPLVVDGLPYLIDRKGDGHRVKVEVYRVDDDTLSRLDSLEGHPEWYERKKIRVNLDKGGTITAWVYMIPDTKSLTHMNDTGIYVDCY